jgi:hypothetical protein
MREGRIITLIRTISPRSEQAYKILAHENQEQTAEWGFLIFVRQANGAFPTFCSLMKSRITFFSDARRDG